MKTMQFIDGIKVAKNSVIPATVSAESREADHANETFPVPKLYMAKKTDVSSARKTVFEFPVRGIIISLFLFGLGYYLERKGLPSDLLGDRAVYLADYVFYGKFSYIFSGVLL
jgi:hypothetical protein